ncbi:efflux RND transporter permease subunit [Halobacteriovorax sp. HLS]|uniref:efflux RND transporter permease subunit n=1 Tax=Halobacteriovorax sp. HLS TaxID=2234000 RepID=UPI000FD88357|nr:efflux RND transporter permease subunit [Halobacteriovorax sp. HLS]
MRGIVSYFTKNHLISNVLFVGVFILAIASWQKIGKEELPEFESNWIRISASYPGASAEDVELFVTKPIEDEIKEVTGIKEVYSTSSVGSSSFRIVLDENFPDTREVVQDIKDATLRASLPRIVKTPSFRQFKSAEKAIIDIGFYLEGHKSLSVEQREELQKFVLNFEGQIKVLPEISGVTKKGYLEPELHILLNPEKIERNDLSIDRLVSIIENNNIRVPLGTLEDREQSKVTAINELETKEDLQNLFVQGNYDGKGVRLNEVATVSHGFEKSTVINKIQGHEGIVINVKKNVSTDILTAQEIVLKFVENFNRLHSKSNLKIVLMDDESYDVKNRLSIVASNGLIGFILIFIVLFIFLDFKSGLWVGLGIPFTLCFTVICMTIIGYTVNNMTLAAIIIVMGIVVDDAIVVAENISRKRIQGIAPFEAAVGGTLEIVKPVFGSILTTCVAFIPLLFFEGFFGKFVEYIPFVVICMLVASLLESVTILPSHLMDRKKFNKNDSSRPTSWFLKYEAKYSKFLFKLLRFRSIVLIFSLLILGVSGYLFKTKMKFVMFPREEGKEAHLKVIAKEDLNRFEMSALVESVEDIILADLDKGVVAVTTTIGESRRGSGVKENQASINIELLAKEDRELSLNQFIKKWEASTSKLEGFKSIKFLKSRWGRDSGAALEVQIQENDDISRNLIAEKVKQAFEKSGKLVDIEIEKPLVKREYNFKIDQEKLVRFNLQPSQVTTSLRAFIEGNILYTISKGNEDVEVRLTVDRKSKFDLNTLRKLRIENSSGGYITLDKIVSIEELKKPSNIQRKDYKRTTILYANIKDGVKLTPLEVAENHESSTFTEILKDHPTAVLSFIGEVKDTRESSGDFAVSLLMVICLIYFILVIMFNSLGAPLLIMGIVPFGLSGVVYVLLLHGMTVYGFFAAVGALGMIGVVVNDAIIMVTKLEQELDFTRTDADSGIAEISSTRLRPIIVTTLTTVAGVLPTAYGIAGYDSMLAEMMLTMGWGLLIATGITLILIPCLYSFFHDIRAYFFKKVKHD